MKVIFFTSYRRNKFSRNYRLSKVVYHKIFQNTPLGKASFTFMWEFLYVVDNDEYGI
jgi:hypothetical protein